MKLTRENAYELGYYINLNIAEGQTLMFVTVSNDGKNLIFHWRSDGECLNCKDRAGKLVYNEITKPENDENTSD